jgi:hypothetical protein
VQIPARLNTPKTKQSRCTKDKIPSKQRESDERMVRMAEINITVHDIVVDYDGITFIEPNGGRIKVMLDPDKLELLKERMEENQ